MNALIEHFAQHHDHLFYALAGICLLLELGVMGINGPLLFIALSSLITGVLITLGIIGGWEIEIVAVGIFAALSAAIFWKPLKKFQNAAIKPNNSSDMIGRNLVVTHAITHQEGRVAYSGIEWQARLDQSIDTIIPVAATAQVVAVDGSLLIVKSQ